MTKGIVRFNAAAGQWHWEYTAMGEVRQGLSATAQGAWFDMLLDSRNRAAILNRIANQLTDEYCAFMTALLNEAK